MDLVTKRINSGIEYLDRLLGDLYIGDNVVWYDDAGSLADVFWLNFIRISESFDKTVVFVSFDRSLKNVIEKLGSLSQYPKLVIVDCFTHGKGAGSDVFLKFYDNHQLPLCRIVTIEEPQQPNRVMEELYLIQSQAEDDVRIVIESLTGMQELWNNEEDILKLYSQSCPRLYELNTIAYWVIEKRAHSSRLKAHINKIAQVAIELSLKRGKTSLTILKAENRTPDCLNIPYQYWLKGLDVAFELDKKSGGFIGSRIKKFRILKGLSQTELAKHIGVTPSNISQVENNQIYPSLPALMKIAEILGIEIGLFFQEEGGSSQQSKSIQSIVFPAADGELVHYLNQPKDSISIKQIKPVRQNDLTELYFVEIMPKKVLMAHFMMHKGQEIGYVISGNIEMIMRDTSYNLSPGHTVTLTSEIPLQWKNNGTEAVRLLWLVINWHIA